MAIPQPQHGVAICQRLHLLDAINGDDHAPMDADESVHIQLCLEISQCSADELLARPGMQREVISLRFQPVDADLLQEAQASPVLIGIRSARAVSAAAFVATAVFTPCGRRINRIRWMMVVNAQSANTRSVQFDAS
jgi:hypothetical protein